MASGLCGRGGPGSLDGSGVEPDAEGGQVTTAGVAACAGRGLVWLSLVRCGVSVGVGSGAAGATAVGKKFSRLSLGCFGVVGVSPVAWEDKGEVREASQAGLSPRYPPGHLSWCPTLGPNASREAHSANSGHRWGPRVRP